MNTMAKRVSRRYIYVLCLLLLLLSGCSLTKSSGDASKTGGSNKTFTNKVLNVAVFDGGVGKEYWEAVKKKFEADYPGVRINLTTSPKIMEMFKPQIIAGNPPDFIYVPPGEGSGMIYAMMKDKLLLDLTDVFEGKALDSDEPLKEKLLSGMMDYVKQLGDGKIYYAPAYIYPTGLFYNQTLFEKQGWNPPKTWEEFYQLGEKAQKLGKYLFMYQGVYPGYNEAIFWPTVASVGGLNTVIKAENYERGIFKSDAVTKSMELFQTLANKGYVLPGTVMLNHIQAQTAFLQGKALFIPCGTWIETEMKDYPREEGFKYGFIPTPVFQEGDQQYVQMQLYDFYIPAKAKNIELAKEFLRYQYKDEIVKLNAQKSNALIAVKDGVEMAKPYISQTLYDAMKMLDHRVNTFMFQWNLSPRSYNIINDPLWNPIGDMMNKSITVTQWQEGLESISAKLRKEIEK